HVHRRGDRLHRLPFVLSHAEREAVDGDLGLHPRVGAGDGEGEGQSQRLRDAAQGELPDRLVAAAAQVLEGAGGEGGAREFRSGEEIRAGQRLVAVLVAGGGGGDVDGGGDAGGGQLFGIEAYLGVPAAEAAGEGRAVEGGREAD